jgi:AcrR family transcriptional regulator
MLAPMPRLWVGTIEEHRRAVEDAILGTTASLVAEHGLAAVTMSRIADETGIGRATLYKYFSEVEGILDAWHERHVAHHLERLTEVRDRHTGPIARLEAVLEAYAAIAHERGRGHTSGDGHHHGKRRPHGHGPHAADISALVHRSEHAAALQSQLTEFVRELIVDAVRSRDLREDIAPSEMAAFCLHALAAANTLTTRPAVTRLVSLTMAGLRRQRTSSRP